MGSSGLAIGLIVLLGISCGSSAGMSRQDAQAIFDHGQRADDMMLALQSGQAKSYIRDMNAIEARATCDDFLSRYEALPRPHADLPTNFKAAMKAGRRASAAWLERCNPTLDAAERVDHGTSEAEARLLEIACEARDVLGVSDLGPSICPP